MWGFTKKPTAHTLAERGMSFCIRPFEERDRTAVEKMAREVVQAGENFAYEEVQPVMGYWLGEGIRTLVAEDAAGAVVGTYALKPNQPGRGRHVANAGYMVHSSARGHGLGRAMCEHSIELAREMGYQSMQFNMVISTNAPAIKLWKDLGFRIVGKLPKVFRHEGLGFVDALIFYREL